MQSRRPHKLSLNARSQGARRARTAGLVVLLLGALVMLLSPQASSAQQGDGGWTQFANIPDGTWQLAPDPANANGAFALNNDGVSRTTDAGATWNNCSRGASMLTLATASPGQQGGAMLYATTPSGLRQSDDGCTTWKDVPSQTIQPSGAHVKWLAPYPNNRQVLYAGMDGLGGLYRSTDGGNTWQSASQGLPARAWVTALDADPVQPSRVFVGLRYLSSGHPPAYIYGSTDGGLTWRSSSLGVAVLPNGGSEITGLAWSGDVLFAATSYDGLFSSTDRGITWHAATAPRPTQSNGARSGSAQLPMPITALEANPEGALIISTPEGAFRSVDGARTWQGFGPAGSEGIGAPLLGFDRNTGRMVLASTSGTWTYQLPAGGVSLPTSVPRATEQPKPTPPPPAALTPPTSTRTPTLTPTMTPTRTPRPTSTPTPTIPAVKGPLPTDKVAAMPPSVATYFPETGHNLAHGFRDYWTSHGGLGFLGYPLTEEFAENGVTVQYFERGRLEYRNGKIGLGLVGVDLTKGQFFQTVRFFPSTDTNVYFGPTQHSLSGPFLTAWQDYGGLSTLGYPLSESIQADGTEYQWFERGRLEWHSDFPAGKRIVLGRVGYEMLYKRGWMRP